jgi:hypothetical protein
MISCVSPPTRRFFARTKNRYDHHGKSR